MADVFSSGCTVIWIDFSHNTRRCCLCLVTHRFTRVFHFSRQLTMHGPTSHFVQKYSMLHICIFSEHTTLLLFSFARPVLWMFHPKRLSWDAIGLGLPLEMPLAVTFSLCKRCVYEWEPPRNVLGHLAALWLNDKECVENGRVWPVEKQFLSTLPSSKRNSISVHHSVALVHKPHVSLVVSPLHEVWKHGKVRQWNCL
jgi:hypothetical protein